MSATAMACAGWLSAGAACVTAAWTRTRLARCVELVAEAGHELRGPLCAAQLGVGLLGADGDARRAAAIDLELRRAGLALADLAGAPAGRRARAPCGPLDVAELVRALEPGWQALAAAHGATLRVRATGAAVAPGRPLRLAQALGNLVANAAEHGGGHIEVAVSAEGGRVRVAVADSGPGLPAPLDDLARAAHGRAALRGHGLAVAHRIAREHGGRLVAAPAGRERAQLVLELPSEGVAGARRGWRPQMPALAAPGRRPDALRGWRH